MTIIYKLSYVNSGIDDYYIDRYNLIDDILKLKNTYYYNDKFVDKILLDFLLRERTEFEISTLFSYENVIIRIGKKNLAG